MLRCVVGFFVSLFRVVFGADSGHLSMCVYTYSRVYTCVCLLATIDYNNSISKCIVKVMVARMCA